MYVTVLPIIKIWADLNFNVKDQNKEKVLKIINCSH